MVKYESEIVWPANGGKKLKVEATYDDLRFVEFYNVNAAAKDATSNETVAILRGALLRRPQACFYEEADAVSQELQELSVTFCKSNGTASRVKHPKLQADDPCINSGGFFNINAVEVKPGIDDQDLDLRLLHEVLVLLKDEWSLAVMMPAKFASNVCHWSSESDALPFEIENDDDEEEELTPEQEAERKERDDKNQRQFARMGFVQAGSTPDLVQKWFLTASIYFEGKETEEAISRWLTVDDVKTLEIHEPPEKHTPTGLDKELYDYCQAYDFPGEDAKERLEDFVKRGASIEGARALHIASSLEMDDTLPIQLLIGLGASVNFQDEFGNTALHVAASQMRHRNITSLLNAGADASLTNMVGETPVQSLKAQLQSYGDMSAAFGLIQLAPQEIDVIPKLESLTALMPKKQSDLLSDGWMSPRMHCMLTITAEIESDGMIDGQFLRGEYIPAEVMKSREQDQGFREGWGEVWLAIKSVLHDNATPTVTRVKEYMENGKTGPEAKKKLEAFLKAEGKIEFALDALLGVTENVLLSGDDGWSYKDFQENVEAIAQTEMDEAFDVAFVMCVTRAGGDLDMRGPYQGGYAVASGLDESYSHH